MLNPDPPKVITDDPSETSSVQRQLFHSRTNGSPPRVALITGAGQGAFYSFLHVWLIPQ